MMIGSIDIHKSLALAPMEDVTDLAFRLICKRLGADLLYTEFINSEGLIRNSEKTHRKMLFREEERPIGIQIYGGLETSMEGAAKMADALHPDLIDINCGCWVKDVAMRGAGAGLLKNLPAMESVVKAVVRSTNKPVTVKTRLGWDESSIRIIDVARMLEQSGVQALTVHCRTRAQGNKGVPDYSWIPKIKNAVSIPVIANGGIDTPQIVARIFQETGCDGVMIGQGAIDNPWIFQQSRDFIETGQSHADIQLSERIQRCLEHLDLSVELKGERVGVMEIRKHYSGYFRGLPGISKLRMKLMTFNEKAPVVDTLHAFRERGFSSLDTN